MFLNKKTEVVIGDWAYPFRNDFRIYIKVFKILGNEEILESDKVTAICDLVFVDKIPPEIMFQAVEGYLRLFSEGKGGQPVFDMEQDKELIYAGFLQSYGIDLDTAEMSIEQFLALLKGLPENTRFAEVIKIRTMPIPKPTKYNTEERQAIIKAKHSVALKGTDNVGQGFKELANMVRAWHGRSR